MSKQMVVAVALALAAIPPFARADDDPQAGAVAFAAGRFAAADRAYEARLKARPNDVAATLGLGTIALYDNDLQRARELLEAAAKLDPGNARAAALLQVADFRATALAAGVSVPDAGTQAPFVASEPLPLLQVSVNGHTADFVLDTGAPDVVLDPDFARELGLDSTAEGIGTFAGGKEAGVGATTIDTFAVGDAIVHKMPAKVIATRSMEFFPGKRVDGIIGTGFLMRFLATIDYPGRRLVLQPRTAAPPANAASVPFWLVGDHFMFAEGQVNDAPAGLFFIDTGLAGGGLMPAKQLIDAAHLKLDMDRAGTGMGGGGPVKVVPFVAERVRLGETTVTNVPGLYTPEGSPFGIFPFAVEGLISHAFFKSYALTFDFGSMHLWLKS